MQNLKVKVAGISIVLALTSAMSLADSIESKVENLGSYSSLRITDAKVKQVNGFLNTQVMFQNSSIYSQDVFYRFKWLDQDGFEVGGEESWKTITLIGKQKVAIRSSAPTMTAKDFRVELQAPRNKSILNPL